MVKAMQHTPYIIAEIGVNHENDLGQAEKMIGAAKNSGAHAVKFQSYKANKLASKHSPAYWDTTKETIDSQYKLFRKFDCFGKKEYKYLAKVCLDLEIDFLSTPFDLDAVDYLDSLVNLYKVASADITNVQLLSYIASKKKPVILSTGASTIGEISDAVSLLIDHGIDDISILHCVLSYPTNSYDANLKMIKHLKAVFPQCKIGYSDHTLPDENMIILTTAFLFGAEIIEKHFTLDKTLLGNDHYHAMDPLDLKKYVRNIKIIKEITGSYLKLPLECETKSRLHARRSVVSKYNILRGEIIEEDLLINKRPGLGLQPGLSKIIIGQKAKVNIKKDTIIELSMIDFIK